MSYLTQYKKIYPIALQIFNNYLLLLNEVKFYGHQNNNEYEIYSGNILSSIDSKTRFVKVYIKFVEDFDGLAHGYITTHKHDEHNKIFIVVNEIVIVEDIEPKYDYKKWSHNAIMQTILHELFHHTCPIVNNFDTLTKHKQNYSYYDRYYEQSAMLISLIEHRKYYTIQNPTHILNKLRHSNNGMYTKINQKKVMRVVFESTDFLELIP